MDKGYAALSLAHARTPNEFFMAFLQAFFARTFSQPTSEIQHGLPFIKRSCKKVEIRQFCVFTVFFQLWHMFEV